jgi:ABC-2 type transport system permease protein
MARGKVRETQGALRGYRALGVAGFRRHSAYPLATIAGGITNSVFGLLRASVTTGTVAAAGGALAGYDAGTAASYAWITQALIAPINLFQWTDLADRIRTGDVAIDLARPVDVQFGFLAADLGRAAYQLLPRGLPPLLVGALTFGLTMPTGIRPYLAGLLSVLLAIGISFGCRFLVNLSSFWLLDIRGAMTVYVVVSNVLCGLFVPVAWFPGWLHGCAQASPFPSMLQIPADLLTGRVRGAAALNDLGVQALWLVAVLVAGRIVLRWATSRLVVQGG